jgi:ABC-type multidrug transport system fused ATPase/permease subunit
MTGYDLPSSPKYPAPPEPQIDTPNQTARRRPHFMWCLFGFITGMFIGGVVSSFIANLLIGLFSATVSYDLGLKNEGILVKLGFLITGLVVGSVIGALSTLPNNHQTSTRQERPNNGLWYNLVETSRNSGFILVDTVRLLIPSSVYTDRSDVALNNETYKTYTDVIGKINLSHDKKDVLLRNWLPQIEWTNNRANRDRDTNETIVWWQIIFAALIPFVASYEKFGGVDSKVIVSFFGIFVAVLTGILQFRRPEERWKHYRILTENYQQELWNYISLAGPYRHMTHNEGFREFHEKMSILRENEIRIFFREINNNAVISQVPTLVPPDTIYTVVPPSDVSSPPESP